MEIDSSKSDTRENESRAVEERHASLRSTRYVHDTSYSIGHTSGTDSAVRSKSETKRNETRSSHRLTEHALSSVHAGEEDVQSSDMSVYNFDAYTNSSTTKRGRGRPRKDGRNSTQVQHRKMLRGRGRPKREESCSSIPQPKIFPGRPRVRTKKIRQLYLPSSSHNSKAQSNKHDIETTPDTRETSKSAEANVESHPVNTNETPVLKRGGPSEQKKKKCSLCNLEDSSCLGQGKLKSFRPTLGFSPGKSTDDSSFSEEKQAETEDDRVKVSVKKRKSLKLRQENMKLRQKSSQQVHDRACVAQNPTAELGNVGFGTPPEIKHVFQTSGETYVHFNCAVWSEGVTRTENDFNNVEKAVLNGMFQQCVKCEKYGATVKCNNFDCDRIYHYPCAIVSGALQITRTVKLLCPLHLDSITDNGITCIQCNLFGDYNDLLMCTLCYKYYHGKCLEPHVDVNSLVRAGWQCIECKTCQTCRQPGDENKMLVCELCDKGYHTFCLTPTIATVPKSGWKCHSCRICGDCGAKTPGSGPSSRWHLNYTVCDSCYQQRNKGVACPLCGKAYRQFSQRKEMRHCCVCKKYIHVECDQRSDESVNPQEYVCPLCVSPIDLEETTCSYSVELSMKSKPVESNVSQADLFSSSRESSSTDNEHSFSSAESDSCPDLTGGKCVSKRRAKTAEFRRRRKKSPKTKLKPFPLPGTFSFATAFSDPKEYKTEDDDPSAENKMVLVSTSDEFVLCQDLCVMCGSFGKGDEGRLIACAQCGQCYHSYCASIKVTPVILKKGWRCLDCTVCEGCGQPHDEGRLLLCDECDISFHIYCLDPPLTEVPTGNWKCKWCVICVKCGSRSPGHNCNWQLNYTHCGPCASFTTCSICSQSYEENDLVIQCNQCERWAHGKCDQIETEEHAEKCADYGYMCLLCRPADEPPAHLVSPVLPPSPEPEPIPEKPPSPPPKVKEPDITFKAKPPVQFYLDGICLSENGLQHIKSLTPEVPKKVSRPRKPRQSSFIPGLLPTNPSTSKFPSGPSSGNLEGPDLGSQLSQGALESSADVKSEPEMKIEVDDELRSTSAADNQRELIVDDNEKKKRPRKMQKLGIGGFVVKPRGRSYSSKELTGEQAEPPAELSQGPSVDLCQAGGSEGSEPQTQEKPKRRRKPKKKTPLDESFPSYLRDAFFGKDLLLSSKKGGSTWDFASQDDAVMDTVSSSKIPPKDVPPTLTQQNPTNSSSDVNVRSKSNDNPPPQPAPPESSCGNQNPVVEEVKAPSTSSSTQEHPNSSNRNIETSANLPENQPTSIKVKEETPSIVDGSSKDPPTRETAVFPRIDTKEIEDVIEGAVHPNSQTTQIKAKETLGTRVCGFLSDASNSPVNTAHPQATSPFAMQRSSTQAHTQSSPIHRDSTLSLHHQDSNSSWSESESSDTAQTPKSTMKWESDETLGLLSTISPVLYANINCPHLKLEFPNWSDRVKQIAKIWRSLPSEKKQPYLQRARENRAASRTQKSTDVDRTSKDAKTQELHQEKEWKQFQALRQLQQQKQQKILQEQRAQALMKAQTDKIETTPPFTDMNNPVKPGPSRPFSDISPIPRTEMIQETDPSKDLSYGKKWSAETSMPKSDDIPNPHLLQQAQLHQGKMDLPVRPPQSRPNQFIQVSCVRPPIETNKICVGDILGPPTNMSPVEHYNTTQSIMSPRCLPPQHSRVSYPPTSPAPRQSLLITRAEMARMAAPPTLQKELLYPPPPPPAAPRAQNPDSFFQGALPPRSPFMPPVEPQSPLANQYPADIGPPMSGSASEIMSPKQFFAQPQNSVGLNRPNRPQVPVSQTNIMDNNKNKVPVPNILPTEHFLHQQPVPLSPVGPGMGKSVNPYKDDLYSSMPGTPQPPALPSQECHTNKLMAHHQLRELLQKQQLNKPDEREMFLQMRGKDSSQMNPWPRGTYNPSTVQYMSKDDCFRHPFPPAVRTRNLSAKDCKSDIPPEILSGANLKLDLLPAEDCPKEDKSVIQPPNANLVPVNLPSPRRCDTQQNIIVSSGIKAIQNDGKSLRLGDIAGESASSALGDSGMKKDMSETAQRLPEENKQPDLSLNPHRIPSPGINKKRKTTAVGDIVKDLESQPEEHDSIANACNLDVLPGDVGELELDDDELLGLGNDFNILEYADPELDKGLVGEGEKRNILDEHLDLDDKDELEDDEEMKEQASNEDKDLISRDVTPSDKGILSVEEVPNRGKSSEKCDTTDLHDEFLEFEKKEDKNSFKNISCETPKSSMAEPSNLIKKESKVSFSSCNISNVTFCSPEDLNLKTETPAVKELHVPSHPSMSFNSPMQGLCPEENTGFPPQIGPPQYRVAGGVRPNLNPPSPHYQQPALVPQPPRNIFPLHVGVPVRPNVPVMQPNIIASQSQQSRPLLLQEQPLLLEDLVEQEKREQLRQTQEGLISPQGDALLSDIDFERLKDDVFSGPQDDSLGGPGSLLGSHEPLKPVMIPSSSSSNTPSHNFCPPPYSLIWQNQEHNIPCPGPPRTQTLMQPVHQRPQVPNSMGSLGLPPGIVLHGEPSLRPVQPQKAAPVGGNIPVPFGPNFLSAPPSPPVVDPHTEQEKQKMLQYEKFLVQQQTVLTSQQKYFETEVIKLRKIKKALNAKQRQLRKNGSELAENDAVELQRISQEQATFQKQLDQTRKQSRQHAIALQDYRLKQQKRHQQQQPPPPPQIPQSPVHASITSLQSSPQSSHSPHQMVAGAPPSPMLPTSPLGPSPSHIQHSPSPMMQQSPVNVSPSSVVQQSSPLVHSHLMPQQVHFQLPRSEGKGWCNPVQMPQVPDTNPQPNERYIPKESHEKSSVSQPILNVSMPTLLEKPERIPECKPKEHESGFKRFFENVDSQSMFSTAEEQTNVLNKPPNVQGGDGKTNCAQEGEPTNYLGITAKKAHMSMEQLSSDGNALKQDTTASNTLPPSIDMECDTISIGLSDTDKEQLTPAQDEASFSPLSSSNVGAKAFEERKFSFAMSAATKFPSTCDDIAIDSSSSSENDKLKNLSHDSGRFIASTSELKSASEPHIGSSKNGFGNNNQVFVPSIKKEVISYDDESRHGSVLSSQDTRNTNEEGSSDEEVESLSREMAALEDEQEHGKQNVLLKQLLQNCPSAESSCKQDSSADVKREDTKSSSDEPVFEDGKDSLEKKGDDPKLKKPSYLDIRRAQLEKEPTPPPGDTKSKTPKRKRPKKKKSEGKEGSPVRKKSRKGSLSKSDDAHSTPLENLMTQLTNLPPLRILEPNIQPNFNILPVYGAGDLNAKENQLKGTYGNASLPNHCDVYSNFPYGKEHCTPTVALPPSPPYRGFYNQEFPPTAKGKSESSIPSRGAESESTFRDVESPDTVISSSSPECCLFEPLCKWPELVFIDHIDQQSPDEKKSYSPVIPLVAPIPIRLVPYPTNEVSTAKSLDKEKDKENIPKAEAKPDVSVLKSKIPGLNNYPTPLKDSGNVAVTLTLSSAAAEDICGVLSRLADLLKIPIPSTYDIVERTATPPSQKLGLYRKSKNSEMNIHSLLNGKPRFCRHCDIVVLSAGIRKKACDLTCISKEEQEEEDEVIFCSTNCYMQFALTHQSSTSALEDKEAAAVVNHPGEKTLKHGFPQCSTKSINEEMQTVASDMLQQPSELIKTETDVMSVIDSFENESEGTLMEIADLTTVEGETFKAENTDDSNAVVDEPKLEAMDNDSEKACIKEMVPMPRKWKSLKYKYWTPALPNLQVYKPVKEEPTEKVTKPFYHTIKPAQMPKDSRRCILCHIVGDGDTNGAARLLNVDVDKWVHLNCALWSAEVYETQNGALMNVETAYKRALMLVCCSCHRHGASLKCFKIRCSNIYHFTCAMKDHCIFFKDKTLVCPHHTNKYSENVLDSLAVYRRVYIDRDEHKQVASMIQGDQYVMRIGNLVFLNIGQLLPQQMQAFHTPNCIYPVGYKVIRMYWSMRKLGKRCQYICSINEVNGKPEFHIQVKEVDQKDVILKDKTSKGLWQKVLYPIEKMRRQAKTIKIFPDFITGDDLFGLTEPAVLRIVESLPGVDTLQDYNFRYGRSPFLELPLAINPTGCARSEPKLRTHVKRSHTLHTSNTSRTSFHSAFGNGIEHSSPYIKQFVHSKSSQYRKMKTEWRNNVYLARSRIQGLGLYAARDLEKHTMVIEYIGQLIRNEIAERNEAIYDAQNRGIYMFRLDENRVIDATLSGGLARYMNHSCNPNCVAEVVQIDRENKILIIANRRISRGEELSYDYKFEVEDDQHKIPCLCKGPNCRKWMN